MKILLIIVLTTSKIFALDLNFPELDLVGSMYIEKTSYKNELTQTQESEELLSLMKEEFNQGGCIDSFTQSYNISKETQENRKSDINKTIEHLFLGIHDVYGDIDEEYNIVLKKLPEFLASLIHDKNTFHVIYSGFRNDGEDSQNSESCMIYNLKIFRNDGHMIGLSFNFSD